MNKLILISAIAAVVLSTSGCAPEIIREGANRDKELYTAQTAYKSIEVAERIALANIPACSFKAAPGKAMVFEGVEEFACYGGVHFTGGSNSEGIQQRISPFWAWSTANMGILGMLGFTALLLPEGVQSGVIDRQVVEPPAQPTQIIQQPFVVRP